MSREFPHLTRNSVMVTDGATLTYNCIAWALGYTDRWINPPNPIANFNNCFLSGSPRGYTQELAALNPHATCDGFGHSDNDLTHASRKDSDRWSSKLGPYLCITHNRQGLNGATYGQILVSYN
ncbi:MAG: hypothetical protein GDA38_04620 [Hormoscilla sp. SP12CHS1]|nr:hypothetical protein [Hormoscilla sp. SP12CHS1]